MRALGICIHFRKAFILSIRSLLISRYEACDIRCSFSTKSYLPNRMQRAYRFSSFLTNEAIQFMAAHGCILSACLFIVHIKDMRCLKCSCINFHTEHAMNQLVQLMEADRRMLMGKMQFDSKMRITHESTSPFYLLTVFAQASFLSQIISCAYHSVDCLR